MRWRCRLPSTAPGRTVMSVAWNGSALPNRQPIPLVDGQADMTRPATRDLQSDQRDFIALTLK
jgi:hypothetical protein